ncbi:hypothetical protein MBEBAB_1651 [Brevundimonas abyssalis TAR-001]|uniref:Uncharacterized protein n=2 Tax=Brevundimonas TaxID=41275 RepID=A0A8E0NBP4_9CAUL|nr:hypothetical protein MBEBAB_1651 [Brevundimonas abyssalis TAR-001]
MLIASLNWTLHYRDVDLTDLGDLALMIGASGLNMSVPQLSVSLKSTGRR